MLRMDFIYKLPVSWLSTLRGPVSSVLGGAWHIISRPRVLTEPALVTNEHARALAELNRLLLILRRDRINYHHE